MTKLKDNSSTKFSEVISSSNEVVIAQCYKDNANNSELNDLIQQGSLVKIKSSYDSSYCSYGIITKINNSSLDNIHKPSALGLSYQEIEELQPQVHELLRKEAEIYLFAYSTDSGEIVNLPPKKPMMVHDFVYFLNDDEIKDLTNDISSIANIIKKHQLKLDLLIEPIKKGCLLRDSNYDYLVQKGQELSVIFSEELDTLMLTLKRIAPEKVK